MWSDEYLACVARTYTSTIYHPVGTCRMGAPKDPRSVVDGKFRMLGGITGLRVVDGSTIPDAVSGNTNAPIIMMAERASDFIKGVSLPPQLPNGPDLSQHSASGNGYRDSDDGRFARRSGRGGGLSSSASSIRSTSANANDNANKVIADHERAAKKKILLEVAAHSGQTNFGFVDQVMGTLISDAKKRKRRKR